MKVKEGDIHRLFWWFRQNYGSYWVMRFNGADLLATGKADWLKGLKQFSVSNVRKALKIVKDVYPQKPPTLEQFSELVKSQKNCRPGHQSFKEYKSKTVTKAEKESGRSHVDKIRDMI